MKSRKSMVLGSLSAAIAVAAMSWTGVASAAAQKCPDPGAPDFYTVDVTPTAACWDYEDVASIVTTTTLTADGKAIIGDGKLSILTDFVMLSKVGDEDKDGNPVPPSGVKPDMLVMDPIPNNPDEISSGLFQLQNYDPTKQYILLFKDGTTPKWAAFLLPALFGYDNGEGFVQGLGFWSMSTKTLSHIELWGTEDSYRPPVPLPAAVWLFGSGLLGLFAVGRRRKSASVATA